MSPTVVVEPAVEVRVPWYRRVWDFYGRNRHVSNAALIALSASLLYGWVKVYTNWSKSAAVAIGAMGVAWSVFCLVVDKPIKKLPSRIVQSAWWLIVPALAVTLWGVSLVALPAFKRNQVVVKPTPALAKTAARNEGWKIEVRQNGTSVCQVDPYQGQILVCGGANTDLTDAEMRPFAARWKGGDTVVVTCTDPSSLTREPYRCGAERFPNNAKETSLEVKIDV